MISRKTMPAGVAAAAALIGVAPALAADATDVRAAIRKLYDAAWSEPPTRIDATYYMEFPLPKWSPEEARKYAADAFEAAEGPSDSLEREELIQMNVDEWLKMQEKPRRILQRIRTDGERWRVDMAILPSDGDVDLSTRLSETYVNLGSAPHAEGYRAFAYRGQFRSAQIVRDDNTPVWASLVLDWLTVPYIWYFRVQWGRLGENKQIVPDPQRRDDCIAKGGVLRGGSVLRVHSETSTGPSGVALDRLEVYGGEGGSQRILCIICDRRDYKRVYRFEACDPSGGLRLLREWDHYDEQGNPGTFRTEEYQDDGAVGYTRTVQFFRIDRNPVFGDEVFQFRPPEGYRVSDARRSPPQQIAEGRPDAPEAGETIAEILALGAPSAVSPHGSRRERLIELPTSRSATQPAAK